MEKENNIYVHIGHFDKDIDDETYKQIVDTAYHFSIQLPGHPQWPLSWRIDMQKWYQAAAAYFDCPDFMSPWHDLGKEQPPFDTVVMVVLPIPNYHGHNYAITSAVCPSPANRDPHAYYDKYGFEELLSTPVAWAYEPDFPKWLTDKILITAK